MASEGAEDVVIGAIPHHLGHDRRYPGEHLERFAATNRTGWPSPTELATQSLSSSFWANYFSPALAQVDLSCRFHDLRHTSVALAIADGAHPKAIKTPHGSLSIN